jgi:hypothetical protein
MLTMIAQGASTPGMRFHKVGSFLSISPTMDLRVIAAGSPEAPSFIYVDHHDAAYRGLEDTRRLPSAPVLSCSRCCPKCRLRNPKELQFHSFLSGWRPPMERMTRFWSISRDSPLNGKSGFFRPILNISIPRLSHRRVHRSQEGWCSGVLI